MPSRPGPRIAALARTTLRIAACLPVAIAAFAQAPAAPSFRDRFPAKSIDSVERADAALAATNGQRGRVETEFKSAAKACLATVLVNACLDRERDVQRRRLADIEAVELEANRFKRRDHADRLEADRVRREAERTTNEPADAEHRAASRKAYDERQAQATREKSDRARSEAARPATPRTRKPVVKPVTPAASEADARQRAKNAADHTTKLQEAATHQQEIERRVVAKAADRKRRADEKAAKEAREAARTAQPGTPPKT